MKILSIDDQGDVRRLIRMTLEFQGHVVLEAFGADDGIRTARKEKPDLILLDLNMPGVDGLETCRRLSSDPTLTHIPVIMLTGTNDEVSRQRALDAGARTYLTKPFNPMGLLELVEHHAT